MNRRSFLSAILAAGVAPAIVRASSLMPIYTVREPLIWLWGDGIHDDTIAMQAFFDGKPVKRVCDGQFIPVGYLSGGQYRFTKTLAISGGANLLFENVHFSYDGAGNLPAFSNVTPPYVGVMRGVAGHGSDTWVRG